MSHAMYSRRKVKQIDELAIFDSLRTKVYIRPLEASINDLALVA